MFGSLMMFASGVLASSPSSASASGTRCSSSRRSGNCARMRPASEMSRSSTSTPAGAGEGLDDRQQRLRRERGRLVGERVDDLHARPSARAAPRRRPPRRPRGCAWRRRPGSRSMPALAPSCAPGRPAHAGRSSTSTTTTSRSRVTARCEMASECLRGLGVRDEDVQLGALAGADARCRSDVHAGVADRRGDAAPAPRRVLDVDDQVDAMCPSGPAAYRACGSLVPTLRRRARHAANRRRCPVTGPTRSPNPPSPPQALAGPGLGAEAALQLLLHAGRRAAGLRVAGAAAVGRAVACRGSAARAWARRAASGSAAATARRRGRPPRRGARGRAARRASRRARRCRRAGSPRVAQALRARCRGAGRRARRRAPRPTRSAQRDARVGRRAHRVARTRRCGRARSGCSRRTRRGAPPSTTCCVARPGARRSTSRASASAARRTSSEVPVAARSRTLTWMPLRAGRLRKAAQPVLVEHLAHDHRRRARRPSDAGRRVEVDAQLVRMVEVAAPRRPRVEVDARRG